jgi:hypothetical protein
MIWTDHYFGPLGILEIVSISFSMLITIIAFILITLNKKILLIILLITLILSSLFVLSISILLFFGTQIKNWNENLGCHSEYKGLFLAWKSVDIYLQSVDEVLCSNDCPCYFNRTTTMKYLKNPISNYYFNTWKVRNVSIDAIKFQDCDKTAQKKAYNNYLMRNAYFKNTLNTYWFNWYFGKVEKFFKCTGFCSLSYYNENIQTNGKILKYLFSDLTKGVPENLGCLNSFLNWLLNTMNAVGILFFFIFLFQFFLCVFVLLLIMEINNYDMDKNSYNSDYNNEEKIQLIENKDKDKNKDIGKKKIDKINLNSVLKINDSNIKMNEIENSKGENSFHKNLLDEFVDNRMNEVPKDKSIAPELKFTSGLEKFHFGNEDKNHLIFNPSNFG